MSRALLVSILIWGSVVQASPPCQDPHANPATCKQLPADWICLSPALAADCPARLEAERARRVLEVTATKAEAETVLRRELGKAEADREATELKLEAALDIAQKAEEEASDRWTTAEVFGFVAAGVAVGAAAGALIYWRVSR